MDLMLTVASQKAIYFSGNHEKGTHEMLDSRVYSPFPAQQSQVLKYH